MGTTRARESGANLEATSGSGAAYGRVSYTHTGGIDRPLVITREGVASIVPHQNWRGQFAMGTYADGPNVGRVSDCGSFPAQNCVPIQWPGERTTVYHELTPDRNIQNWFGSLVDDMRDATGQQYRRNRYHDPQTGQFIQPDPIGLAGGLNAYGFAAGDSASYSAPVDAGRLPSHQKPGAGREFLRSSAAPPRTWPDENATVILRPGDPALG